MNNTADRWGWETRRPRVKCNWQSITYSTWLMMDAVWYPVDFAREGGSLCFYLILHCWTTVHTLQLRYNCLVSGQDKWWWTLDIWWSSLNLMHFCSVFLLRAERRWLGNVTTSNLAWDLSFRGILKQRTCLFYFLAIN